VAAPTSATSEETLDDRPSATLEQVRDSVLAAEEDAFVFTSCTRCPASTDVSSTDASSPGEMPALL
jgi:hypothetical protein